MTVLLAGIREVLFFPSWMDRSTFSMRIRRCACSSCLASATILRFLAKSTDSSVTTRTRLIACCLLWLSGCNKPPFDVAPVRGQVTIDGDPVTGIKVMFAPVAKGDSIESGKPAFGLVDDEGRFVLSTYGDEDGAVVGKHWVTLNRFHRRSAVPRQEEPREPRANSPEWDKLTVGPRPFEVLPDTENEIDIELTSDDVRRFARKNRD